MTRASRFVFAGIIVLACSSHLSSQTVQSFCSGPSSLQNQYLEDAWYVAYDYQLKTDSIKMVQTVPINPLLKDTILSKILGVFNADLPARDTVFQKYNIHAYKDIDLRRFELYLDTTHAWVRRFLDGKTTSTGNYYVDSLAAKYGFSIEFLQYFPDWVLDFDALVRVKTNTYVNTDFLAEVMLGQDGVKFANAYTFGGDGNRIFYKRMPDHAELVFRRGWEDCPSGCLFQRDWVFRVYDDCQVEYVTSYGDSLGSSPTKAPVFAAKTRIFPNPASDRLFVECQDLGGDFLFVQITNDSGKTIQSIALPVSDGAASGEIDISRLGSGLYFIGLSNENQVFTKKLVVFK